MREIDRSPARLSGWASIATALVSLVTSGLYSWVALAVGAFGLLLLVVGLGRGTRGLVDGGTFCLFGGAIVAGAGSAPVAAVLIGVTAAVLAWDVGGRAISVGAQLGRDADTVRLEAVHVTTSTVVGALVAGTGFGLYRVGSGEQPVVALVLLVVAAVLLVQALS